MIEPTYLGDGVYASFDGYHICLQVGDHKNPTLVYLEAGVMENLKRYSGEIQARTKRMLEDVEEQNNAIE